MKNRAEAGEIERIRVVFVYYATGLANGLQNNLYKSAGGGVYLVKL